MATAGTVGMTALAITDRPASGRDAPTPIPGERAPRPGAATSPAWQVLTQARERPGADTRVSSRRVFLQVGLVAALVLALVAGVGVLVAHRTAEREAMNDAARTTDLLARSVLQPSLQNGLATGAPAAAAALDPTVRNRVLDDSIVRVKIWAPDGTIVYSDEARLIGRTFAFGAEERDAIDNPATKAEITDLSRPENEFERGSGKLLEVYRPVWTPDGHPLLFETYTKYSAVSDRTGQLWRGFAGVVLSSLLLMVVLLVPVVWALLDRLRRAHRNREELLRHAVDASGDERRRIAGTLHDGVVQDLAATSFALSGTATSTARAGHQELAGQLTESAAAVCSTIGGLRSLLVDIYPPTLRSAGLVAALEDLAGTVRSRGVAVRTEFPNSSLDLTDESEQLVFRVAQECLRNVLAHAAAGTVLIQLVAAAPAAVLTIADDGHGFDLDSVPAEQSPGSERSGHLGIQLVTDLTASAGARLDVATAIGEGTQWRLTVPTK